MRRISPQLPLPGIPAPRTARPGYAEATYTLSAVTPVIGAGVEGGVVDIVTPIRGGTIRGLLRSWWRVFFNAQNLESLQKKETAIWGWASSPGCVDVHVHDIVVGPIHDNWTYYEKLSMVSGINLSPDELDTARYLLFPLQKPRQNRDAKPKSGVLEKLTFQLTVRCQEGDVEKHVRAALRGWVQFGGIGARTHRGCGSLYCPDLSPAHVQQAQGWPRAAPHDTGEWAVYKDPPLTQAPVLHPVRAWLKAARVLRTFRQNPIGRTGRSRSHWPEPDSIRRISGGGPSHHQDNLTDADNNFPRAALGLPIVFHFKDELANNSSLVGHTERMTSPLIFKALPFGDGTQALPAILALHYRRWPDAVKLVFENSKSVHAFGWDHAVLDPAVANYLKSPLHGRTKNGSAVEALLTYAKQNGFK